MLGSRLYLVAALPWLVLAPMNLFKLLLNTVSPTAHLWVPRETEQCQAGCGIARMWATLFWSQQFSWGCALLYAQYVARHEGLILFSAVTKLMVGTLLFNGYLGGVIHWPIGLGASTFEFCCAALMLLDVTAARAAARRPFPPRYARTVLA
mmetsp:Transcript_8395/g.27682  ORF Transcript_8395/g.27682 Transcript_8395/m.27682 type:complete len:151 (-) Transcript_8395:385-837(-)